MCRSAKCRTVSWQHEEDLYQDAARRRHSLILLLVSWALLESQLQSCWGIHQNKSPEITKIR